MKNKIIDVTQTELTPSTIETVVEVVGVGDDTAVEGGAFTGTYQALYTIEVTTAGTYGGVGRVTVTCEGIGGDSELEEEIAPVSATPFNLGTEGATLTLTDGSDTVLTLGDKWTVQCYGLYFIIDTYMSIKNILGRYKIKTAKTIKIDNTSGAVIGFNIIRNDVELVEMEVSATNFDFIPINDSAYFEEFNVFYKPYKILLKKISGTLSGGASIHLMDF